MILICNSYVICILSTYLLTNQNRPNIQPMDNTQNHNYGFEFFDS